MPLTTSHHDRVAIAESRYGRDCGWYVESNKGERLAELIDCEWAEMFWDSYRVVPIAGHEESLTEEFWYPDCHKVRNRVFDTFVVETFGHFNPTTQRVALRSLYLPVTLTLRDKMRAPLRCWRVSRDISHTE
jgi:hypothetical protein